MWRAVDVWSGNSKSFIAFAMVHSITYVSMSSNGVMYNCTSSASSIEHLTREHLTISFHHWLISAKIIRYPRDFTVEHSRYSFVLVHVTHFYNRDGCFLRLERIGRVDQQVWHQILFLSCKILWKEKNLSVYNSWSRRWDNRNVFVIRMLKSTTCLMKKKWGNPRPRERRICRDGKT